MSTRSLAGWDYTRTVIASSGTPTPTGDTFRNFLEVSAAAANMAIAVPTGTPQEGNTLLIVLIDNGTSRTISYTSSWLVADSGIVLPTATVANKIHKIGCIYAGGIWNGTAVGVSA